MSKYAAKKARKAEEAARAERLAHEKSQARAAIADGATGSHGKWICDYLYHDTDGTVLYKASRYLLPSGRNSFCIKHRDDRAPGGWAYGFKDAGLPRVVYHLPDVIAAAKSGRMVVVAEGEKDVDNLRALGFVATCNVGGAGKWGYGFPKDWGGWFKGVRAVLIIADNDPETNVVRKKVRGKDEYTEERKPFLVGQKHAWDVRRQLLAAGYEGEVNLMVMPAVGEAHPKDFTDWMDAAKAAGVTDVKAAFKAAVASAVEAGWPTAWQFTVERAEVDPDEAAKRKAQSEADKAKFDVKCYAGLGRLPELVCKGIEEAMWKVDATLFFADELKDCAKSQAKSEAEALRNSLRAVGQKLDNLRARYARIVERSNHANGIEKAKVSK